jgi:hypothetical protein
MVRGPLYQPEYRPLFSGHETFPLRYGWLKKAYDAVLEDAATMGTRSIFLNDVAIARFGVGKNMVGSMRHWASCAGIIGDESTPGSLKPTAVGHLLFGSDGVDRYLEHPASLWHIHWLLCSGTSGRPIKTTWFWVFNHLSSAHFRRDELVDSLGRLAEVRGWRLSRTTVQRDVECFIRMYEARQSGNHESVENQLESPLAELGLIRGVKGNYHLVRGPKPTLPDGVFAAALDAFWTRQGDAKTLSYEMVAHEPGSPGRVFLLDEADLANRLLELEGTTKGAIRWSETAGLKQLLRDGPLRESDLFALLRKDYHQRVTRVG